MTNQVKEQMELPNKKYKIIYAAPPWAYKNGKYTSNS